MTNAVGIGKRLRAAAAYSFGEITAVAAAFALHRLDNLAAEHDGIGNLAYCDGQIGRYLHIAWHGAETVSALFGAEYLYRALRAEKDHSLFGNCNTLKFYGL